MDQRKIIRAKQIKSLTGLSVPTIHRRSRQAGDDFPSAIRLSPYSIGWYEDEIIAWRNALPRESKAA
jgi:predicted DNA-binding transcriptional regulator AlpA